MAARGGARPRPDRDQRSAARAAGGKSVAVDGLGHRLDRVLDGTGGRHPAPLGLEATLTVLAPAAGAAFYVWVRGLGYGWAAWLLGAPVTAAGCLLWFRRRRRLEREAAAVDEYGDPALPQNIGEAARQARRRRELGEG